MSDTKLSDERLEVFNRNRPLLFSIAYRMLSSAADAEDILQDAYLRWESASEDEVRSPRAYLTSIVTRLSIDQLRSARARREVYVGQWLPEPLLTSAAPELVSTVELAESISMAFLVVLEELAPVERAVFLLREVFDYSYPEIAQIVDKSEANCRQMVTRARSRVRERRPRFEVSREQQERVVHKFMEVCEGGDMNTLLSMLTDDVVMVTDGGGKTRAAINPIYGRDKVARFIFAILQKAVELYPGAELTASVAEINGQPGIITYADGVPYSTVTLELDNGRITHIDSVVNPEKLERVRRET